MRRVLLAAPNVSEGRDVQVVQEIAEAVADTSGVKLLDHSSDPDHHRSVFTYVGRPEAVLSATRALAERALSRIDMRRHRGGHPRLGAVDVVPFVPIRGVSEPEALDVARRFGRWAGERGIPVYYYEASATRPERRALPAIRSGGYEGLARRLRDPEWVPDEGPARFVARSGAIVTGVRPPLVAFNVNLRSRDVELAWRIAREIRGIGGGHPSVRAIGVDLAERAMVQVSMNLTRPFEMPPAAALAEVRAKAAEHGVEVAGTELIGPVPLEVVVDAFRALAGADDFRSEQIIELALLEDEVEAGEGASPRGATDEAASRDEGTERGEGSGHQRA